MDTAQNLLIRLRQNYIADIPERAAELETLILEIVSSEQSQELYSDLFRRIHSLKGSGGTYGAQIVTAICHSFEDYLATLSLKHFTQNAAATDIALSFVDLLRTSAATLGERSDDSVDIEAALATLRQRAFTPQYSALVVESGISVIRMVAGILNTHGFRMVLIEDGYQALGRALVEPFDLLITSVEVPSLNGNGLIAALKLAQIANRRVKCILLTSNHDEITASPEADFRLLKDARMRTTLNQVIADIVAEKNHSH